MVGAVSLSVPLWMTEKSVPGRRTWPLLLQIFHPTSKLNCFWGRCEIMVTWIAAQNRINSCNLPTYLWYRGEHRQVRSSHPVQTPWNSCTCSKVTQLAIFRGCGWTSCTTQWCCCKIAMPEWSVRKETTHDVCRCAVERKAGPKCSTKPPQWHLQNYSSNLRLSSNVIPNILCLSVPLTYFVVFRGLEVLAKVSSEESLSLHDEAGRIMSNLAHQNCTAWAKLLWSPVLHLPVQSKF